MSDGDAAVDPRFDALLGYLQRSRGFNFGGYKRASLMRRVDRRIQAVGMPDYSEYRNYLEAHPEEFAGLFDAILINVTGFFRDAQAWETVANDVVPRLIDGRLPGEPIRAWSAGCASGAEAYTLAIILAEALGIEAFRDRVKIYATDIDDRALASARQARFEAREVEGVPAPLLEKYFDPVGPRYSFNKELRRAVIFGRHDLMQDAPISRVDLLICRNTLMYFKAEAQARILERLHFALSDRGFLFLGKAETLLSYGHLFAALDIKRRLFTKLAAGSRRPRAMALIRHGDGQPFDRHPGSSRIREFAFDQSPYPQLVIDASGHLTLVNEPARLLFGLTPADLGRPLQDLQISYRPTDLRSCVDRACAERRPVGLDGVEWPGGGGVKFYDIRVVPLIDAGSTLVGVVIAFTDVSDSLRIKDDLEQSTHALEATQEELQSVNEELETTNEEIQSANEELETTNEELQSANEELETTNEELQSANEELETVNDELRQRSDELNESNFFLESVLSSLNSGIVVVDADLIVRAWNARTDDMWGLRGEEVRGKYLLDLDIGLPVGDLRPSLQACLDDWSAGERVTLDATNRRGRATRCRVTCSPMRDASGVRGVVLIMEAAEDEGKAERDARPAERETHDGLR